MKRYYKYPRKEIVELIKKSPKTCDGYYYFPKFSHYNLKVGNINNERDTKYYYKRELFKNKICFNEYDINCYLSTLEINYDVNKMEFIDEKIKDIIKDFTDLKLNDKVPSENYTLNELIDTSIFFYNNKYI